jgi:hypothetical protein
MMSKGLSASTASLVISLLALLVWANVHASADPKPLQAQDQEVKDLQALVKSLQETERSLVEQLNSIASFTTPIGTVVAYSGHWPPAGSTRDAYETQCGWMLCDGRALSSRDSKYKELYGAIGDLYGTTGDKFNLPDYRGVFLRGTPEGNDRLSRAASDNRKAHQCRDGNGPDAAGIGTYQEDAFLTHEVEITSKHQHIAGLQVYGANAGDQYDVAAINGLEGASRNLKYYTDHEKFLKTHHTVGQDEGRSKGGNALETRPKNVAVHYLIRASIPQHSFVPKPANK